MTEPAGTRESPPPAEVQAVEDAVRDLHNLDERPLSEHRDRLAAADEMLRKILAAGTARDEA